MAHIIVVEADRTLGRLYQQAISDDGHTVQLLHDAQAAISAIDEQRPALIVLDIMLGEHNGVEFLYELRSYPEWDGIPVILHTVVPSSHPGLGHYWWSQLGIVSYLYKPNTSLQQLRQAVSRQLATEQSLA